jgi:hypothetical protein
MINRAPDPAVSCPFCGAALRLRRDKRGGRYFRCGTCLTAFFASGPEVIAQLERGGTFMFSVQADGRQSGG